MKKKIIEITSIKQLMEMGMTGGGVSGHPGNAFKPKKEESKMRKELQTEIARLREIDKKISDRVSAELDAEIEIPCSRDLDMEWANESENIQ